MSELSPEQKASQLGWKPQEQFQGDPSKWVSAEEFLDRADHVMPILRENNRRLQGELESERKAREKLELALSDMRDSVEAMKEYQTKETERAVKQAREALLTQLRQAKTDGDVDLEVRLTSELSQVDADLRAAEVAKAEEKETAEKAKGEKAPTAKPELDPAFLRWQGRNEWYGKDPRKTAIANGIAMELRRDPSNNTLIGDAFFSSVDKEIADVFERLYGEKGAGAKVEGGGGGGGSRSQGGKKTFASLPADAKETCERQASRMVGPNRAFKDMASWQKHYAEQYYAYGD